VSTKTGQVHIDAVDEDAARALIHWSLGARDDTPDEVRDACRNLLLTKHPRWAYENEVRAVKRPHSLLEEEHIYQNHPLRRIALSPSRVVAPMIQVPSVAGLSIFDHQVPIVEVYLGARNPLCTAKQNPSAFVDRSLVEKALAEKWTIYRTEVDSSSWNLRAVKLGVESLGVVSRVSGLIHYSKLPGRVARMVRDTLAGVEIDDNNVFEASNWNGECHIQKNGMFVGKNGKLID